MYGTIFDPDLRVFQDAELLNEQGEYYANMLYAFRSVSRAIPATKETDAATKKIFNMRTFEVLAPEMDRLKELLTYAEEAKKFFVSVLSRMAGVDSGTTRDLFCEVLIKLLDTLQKIDNLKDGKACLQNDFAAYKRSFHLVRADVPAADIIQEDIQQLQMFLGNPYHNKLLVVNQLREQVKQVPKHEEVLLEMITICCNRIEKGVFVTPDEKCVRERRGAVLLS
jgi:cytoplasmic FMR1 interacting protein